MALLYTLTYLLCMQYALFLAMVALPASIVLLRLRHLKPKGLSGLLCAVICIFLFVGPLAFLQGRTLEGAGLLQGHNETKLGAATPISWLTVPWRQFVMAAGIGVAAEPGQQALFPGLFKLLFACVGIVYGLRRRHLRRVTLFALIVAGLGVFFSLMASVFAGKGGIFEQVQTLVPGLQYVANTWRFGIITQLALVILAALGIQRALGVRLYVIGRVMRSPLDCADCRSW